MKYLLVVFGALILINSASAQKDRSLFFGVNVGVKLANKNYAARYSGAYQNELYYAINQQFTYDEIYRLLGDKHFALAYDAYPLNMRYSPGLVTGLTVGYQLNPNIQMSLDANFNKLTAKDVFTVEVFDPTNGTSEPVINIGQLVGKESRFDGRYNIDYVADGTKARFIIGLSGIFNAWRIDEHVAIFQGYSMPLFSKFNPTNNFTNKVSGMGWGGGINIGVEYPFSDNIIAQIMYQPYQTKVDYGYLINKRIILQHDLTVRFLWK